MKITKYTPTRHHLLEIILWPMPDGTFKEIRNSAARLKELGIYDEFRLTIPLRHGDHQRLHTLGQPTWNKGKKFPHSEEWRRKVSLALTGRTFSAEHRKHLSEVPRTEEWLKHLSESHKGQGLGNKRPEHAAKMTGNGNPMKRDDVRKAFSARITGRKKRYDADGKWHWYYPNKEEI